MIVQTMRTTTSDAIVRFLIAQHIEDETTGEILPLFPYCWAIFGHGNALSLGESLELHKDSITTLRGQNETGMTLAAVGYTKAARRRQIGVVTASIGPGTLNTTAGMGAAMVNRLPLLMLVGDTFTSRTPDPVLQQIETFDDPTITVNDALKPLSRYWDRITTPGQLLASLPQMLGVLLDPAVCGPAVLALPQDVQAEAFDFPVSLFEKVIHRVARPRASRDQLEAAADRLRRAERPLIIAGGGVHYSLAESELSAFAARHGIPVVETVSGKSSLLSDDAAYAGPIGVLGSPGANSLAAQSDVVVAVGTRLQDFTTGSWTVFRDENLLIIGINTQRFDALKRRGVPVVGDARETLSELSAILGGWRADDSWMAQATEAYEALLDEIAERTADHGDAVPTYAQVVGAVNAAAADEDLVLTAAGGLPGELNMNWISKGIATFDCEYGFSCMGYEVSGAWGAALERASSRPGSTVYGMTGDGSFMMLPSDIYSAVLHGTRVVFIVCDNGGFNVIERLQVGHGAASFRTMLIEDHTKNAPLVDFELAARAMGAQARTVTGVAELTAALEEIKGVSGVHVIVTKVKPAAWSEGGSFWEVGVPEVSHRDGVATALQEVRDNKVHQQAGW